LRNGAGRWVARLVMFAEMGRLAARRNGL
jgi:hypothetical protein